MPAVLAFGGNKSQTDFFFSFMFHLQTTRQQTSVFTPMLIKVNYLVVRGHWWKTCGLLGLCYVRKFKTSRRIQHQLMACVCFPVRFQSIFFNLCLNYFCSARTNVSLFLQDFLLSCPTTRPSWGQNIFSFFF